MMRKRTNLSSLHDEIVKLAKTGIVGKQIAARLGVDRTGLKRYCDRHGIKVANRRTIEAVSDAVKTLAESGKTSAQIASKLGFSQVTVNKWCSDNSVLLRDGYHSRVIIAKGKYILVQAPGHPTADSKGYVRLHRLIVEAKIGRYLAREEIVHHIDGNTFNNDPLNLEITTRAEHGREHTANGDSGWGYVHRKNASKR